jgi:hypothetical protein
MQPSPTPCHFTSLQRPVLNNPQVYVPSSMSETKFHTRTELQAILLFLADEKTKASGLNGSKECILQDNAI